MSESLADLHLHLYGAIPASLWHDLIAGRDINWHDYERAFAAAYGRHVDMAGVLGQCDRNSSQWRRHFEFGSDDAGNFDRFQAKFNLLISSSALAGLDGSASPWRAVELELDRVVDGLAHQQRRHGVDYAEYRMMFGPRHSPATVERAARRICYAMGQQSATTMRLALSLPRADPWPMWGVVQAVLASDVGSSLTAIDFCGTEEGFPPQALAGVLADVHRFNARHPDRAIATLVHVGESYRDKTLESAVRWVHQAAVGGAHRLGHALALGIDPQRHRDQTRHESPAERLDQIAYDLEHAVELRRFGVRVDIDELGRERLQRQAQSPRQSIAVHYDQDRVDQVRRRQEFAIHALRDRGTIIEVCPTSNYRIAGLTHWPQHPLPRFLAAGLRVVVGSDDPGLLGTSLRQELSLVGSEIGVTATQCDALVAQAWAARSECLAGRRGVG
ncbi:MAG: hypothetical protein B7733_22910 [Myxococcales bacterium FL481]|nr:MAG: hypothetical protein B7733_22910 [Myxococcales bacterium FL481]